MKLSENLKRETAFVEALLGEQVICNRCGCKLQGYTSQCTADLSDACPGFSRIEEARRLYAKFFLEQVGGSAQ